MLLASRYDLVSSGLKVLVATKPINVRKGMDGLAARDSKLNGIDPHILARIARSYTINRLDRLLSWNWKTDQVGQPQPQVKSAVAVPAH